MTNKYAQSGFTRAFIKAEGSSCTPFRYISCLAVDGLSGSNGDITSHWIKDPAKNDNYITIAALQPNSSRPTTTLRAWLRQRNKGILEELYKVNCGYDIQIHFGECENPSSFNEYEKILFFKNALVTNYNLTNLTAKSPEDRAIIEESVTISMDDFFTFIKPSLVRDYIVINMVYLAGQYFCDAQCMECEGCASCPEFMAVAYLNNQSICSPGCGCAFVIYSKDCNKTRNYIPIPDCVPPLTQLNYVNMHVSQGKLYLVFANTAMQTRILVYDVSDINQTGTLGTLLYSETINLFNATSIWFINNKLYMTGVSSSDVYVLDENFYLYDLDYGIGVSLTAIHGLNENDFYLGGQGGYFAHIVNGNVTPIYFPNINPIQSIKVLTDETVLIGTNSGLFLYCTCDNQMNPIFTQGSFNKIIAVDENIIYTIVNNLNSNSEILLSIDGGLSWTKVNKATLTQTHLYDISVCPEYPELIWSTGITSTVGLSWYIFPNTLNNTNIGQFYRGIS